MRPTRRPLSPAACLGLLLMLAATLLPGARPAPTAAQASAGGSFGSAVPCLSHDIAFATTCFADTMFHVAPAGDPALVRVGLGGKAALAPLGARTSATAEPPPLSARITNGIGSIYGLAYDDGTASGVRRLFAAAYTRRFTSFGPGGPGGIYAYDFAAGSWGDRPIISVPDAGWERTNRSDMFDAEAITHTGRSGLGDMEISPDGRELFVVNIGARRIERYDLTVSPPRRDTPISIDDGALDEDDALDAVWSRYREARWYTAQQERDARAETVPFALEFSPFVIADGPALVLGLTDTMRRAVRGGGGNAPAAYPGVHVVTYFLGRTEEQRWAPALSQLLDAAAVGGRMDGSYIGNIWASEDLPSKADPYGRRGLRGWNPWHENLGAMPSVPMVGLGRTIFYPQPLLTDIEFSDSGRRMFLGIRDRTGDQVMAAEAPGGQFSAIAQGDTLAYNLSGGSWVLQTPSRESDPVNLRAEGEVVRPAGSDYFNDSQHSFAPGSAPAHIENHGGALATLPRGEGGSDELVATTSLFGERQSGIGFYGQGGGGWVSERTTLVTASPYAGGKAANLGDLEALCTYAFVAGRVWDDQDGDGQQDSGEPSLSGVGLELFYGDPSGPQVAAALTDSQGRYRFAVPPNTPFRIRVAAADFAPGAGRLSGYRFAPGNVPGVDDTRDSDAAQAWGYVEFAGSKAAPAAGDTGQALSTPVREQELGGVDIGLTSLPPTGVIGDRVWVDADGDGLQDGDELGLPAAALEQVGIRLEPDAAMAPGVAALPPVERGEHGAYHFRRVTPGRYRVTVERLPSGYALSPYRAGGGASDGADSDFSPGAGVVTRYVTVTDPPPADANSITALDLGLVPELTDVAVELSAPATVLVGQPIAYTLTARNLSAAGAAHNVVLEQLLPDETALVAAEGGAAQSGRRLTWALGTLVAGQARTLTVRVSAPTTNVPPAPATPLGSTAWVRTSTAETTTANNVASAATDLVRPELRITKAGPAAALVGDELTYTLTYSNRGSTASSGVTVADSLPAGVVFTRFLANPGGACGYSAGPHRVSCALGTLPPGATGSVQIGGRMDGAVAGEARLNTATIGGETLGDDQTDNRATVSTTVLRPNPGVQVVVRPGSIPFGTGGVIEITYGNGLRSPASGEARGVVLTVQLPTPDMTMAALPAACRLSQASLQVRCELGTLAGGARSRILMPFAVNLRYSGDSLSFIATIATATPERPEDLGDNTAEATANVLRPNVFVDATGPSSIVGRGSVFWYTLDYGNIHRPSPALTAPAEEVRLTATLPPQVELVAASLPPSATDPEAHTLTWSLGTLGAKQTGKVILVVRTAVDAGAVLRLDAAISTRSFGDDPADNADRVMTEVVQPPEGIPVAAGELRLAVRSELDPNSQDRRPDNGVYLTTGPAFSWPAGETLNFTPRLTGVSIPGEASLPYPYAYRARVVGWSLRSATVNGKTLDPAGADSRGRAGCRSGAPPAAAPGLLEGCAYGYLDGSSIEAIRRGALPAEDDLRRQGHIYWSPPPAPALPDEVYAYAVDPLTPVRLEVQVEIEIQIVNAAPGAIGGIPLPEVPVVPLPSPERQLVSETFEVTLLVPRSVVGPGAP